jgi:hypothetical protein
MQIIYKTDPRNDKTQNTNTKHRSRLTHEILIHNIHSPGGSFLSLLWGHFLLLLRLWSVPPHLLHPFAGSLLVAAVAVVAELVGSAGSSVPKLISSAIPVLYSGSVFFSFACTLIFATFSADLFLLLQGCDLYLKPYSFRWSRVSKNESCVAGGGQQPIFSRTVEK